LIESGFARLADVAATPRTAFVQKTGPALGDFQAAALQRAAFFQAQVLDSLTTGLRVEQANRYSTSGLRDPALGQRIHGGLEVDCGCADCEAAVSPGAYLADLLDYALRHVTQNGEAISLQFLADTFEQPFADLPLDCDAVEEEIRQVRLAVEMLRRRLHVSHR